MSNFYKIILDSIKKIKVLKNPVYLLYLLINKQIHKIHKKIQQIYHQH